jgi:hypothetical protein
MMSGKDNIFDENGPGLADFCPTPHLAIPRMRARPLSVLRLLMRHR